MNEIVAFRISKKMSTQISDVKNGLTSWDNALAHFTGFMDAMSMSGLVTSKESGVIITEFTRLIFEPVII